MGHGEGRCDIELSGTSADIVDGRPPQYRRYTYPYVK